MEFDQNDYNSKRYSFDSATAMFYDVILFVYFRISDDNIEMQSCEPYVLHNVPPSTDTIELYERV